MLKKFSGVFWALLTGTNSTLWYNRFQRWSPLPKVIGEGRAHSSREWQSGLVCEIPVKLFFWRSPVFCLLSQIYSFMGLTHIFPLCSSAVGSGWLNGKRQGWHSREVSCLLLVVMLKQDREVKDQGQGLHRVS